MSKKQIEKALADFLTDNSPQVVVIKGPWGSGKSHFWNNYLKENKEIEGATFKRYSYCSVFGFSSTDDVRQMIFQNSIGISDIGKELQFSLNKPESWSLKKAFSKTGKILERIPVIKEWNPFPALGTAAGFLGFLDPHETLVCIDDFERISDRIDPVQLLGIISELKEQRKCKVVLIFNDSKLDDKTRKAYAEFREKIVDIEFHFDPTSDEVAEIAFASKNPHFDIYQANCVKLGITNIRILKQAERTCEIVLPLLENPSRTIIEQIISSIFFFSYSLYANSSEDTEHSVPSVDYLLSYNPFGNFGKSDDETKKYEKWNSTIRNFGWTHADELDIELLDTVKRGYAIDEKITDIVTKKNEEIKAGDHKAKYSKVWREIYHNGFTNDENAFVEGLIKAFHDGAAHLDGGQANETICILRKLGRNTEADSVIEMFIAGNSSNPEKLKMSEFGYRLSSPMDDGLKDKLIEATNSNRNTLNLKQVLDSIIERNGSYGQEDEAVIFQSSEDEVYELFKNHTGDLNHKYREILMKYKRVSNASDDWRAVTEKTENALRRFGTTNLNKLRLESYGISPAVVGVPNS